MNKQNYEKALGMISSAMELLKKALGDKKPMSIDDHRQVTICKQTWKQTWLAENLKIDDGGEGIYFNEENSEYYYTWVAAVRIAKSIPGWHLPTIDEWNELAKASGDFDNAGKYLKSTTRWNGSHSIGFSVFPTGYLYKDSFYNVGSDAYFWTATEYSSTYAYNIYFGTDISSYSYTFKNGDAFSVRLVKDS